MYVRMHVYNIMCMYVRILLRMCMYVHMYVYIRMYMYVRICMYVCMHVYVCMYVRMSPLYVGMVIYVRIYTKSACVYVCTPTSCTYTVCICHAGPQTSAEKLNRFINPLSNRFSFQI